MYYFGTNLDNRFSVPDFWPRPEQTHRIPSNKEEVQEELERLRTRRLALRERRLEKERVEMETQRSMREAKYGGRGG